MRSGRAVDMPNPKRKAPRRALFIAVARAVGLPELLRFYEEVGLFAPARTDPGTGYRYYSAAQLPELARILVLKELGFSLEQIRDVLKAGVGPAELRGMLLARRNEVVQTLEAESQRLRQIETRIAQIEAHGALSADDVMLRAEPARRFLSLRRTVDSFRAARVRNILDFPSSFTPAAEIVTLEQNYRST